MSRRARLALFAVAGAGLAVFLVLAYTGLPDFGTADHPYGYRAVAAALAHHTVNTISSVNFDQRAVDTLGEEYILFGAVTGTLVILRPLFAEWSTGFAGRGRVLAGTRLAGALLLPVALLVGVYIVDHGQLSPGGGFQGGVVVATAWHLLYVADRYSTLRRLRPGTGFEIGEAAGAGAFAVLGIAALAVSGAFLANVVPTGTPDAFASGGTVPLLNAAVGVEVACGVVVLLAAFLRQSVELRRGGDDGGAGSGGDG